MKYTKEQRKNIIGFCFAGLFMGGMGSYFAFGALGFFELKGMLVEPWIVACGGFLFMLGGAAFFYGAWQEAFPYKLRKDTTVISPLEGGANIFSIWVATAIVLLLVTMFWGLILTDARMEGNMPMWMFITMIAIFTLIGIALFIYALWFTSSHLQFANLKLTINDYPPRVGGKLSARLSLSRFQNLHNLDATLKFYKMSPSTFGLDGSISDAVKLIDQTMRAFWEDSKRIPVKRNHQGAYALVEFDLPEDLQASLWVTYKSVHHISSLNKNTDLCRWVLEIEKEIQGPDLKRSYELPVFPALKDKVVNEPEPEEVASTMSRQDAVAMVTLAELEQGSELPAIAAKLTALGVTPIMINKGFRSIFLAGSSKYENKFLAYLEEQKRQERQKQKPKIPERVKRIRQIALQQRAKKPELTDNPLTEIEFHDIIRYTGYIFKFAPVVYFIFLMFLIILK